MSSEQYRKLPSVDSLLNHPDIADLLSIYGRSAVACTVRQEIERAREEIVHGGEIASDRDWPALIEEKLTQENAPVAKKVINCSGVIIHTNLGRSLLAKEATKEMMIAMSQNIDLEYDLEKGTRGERDTALEKLICRHTGAESATVVNNNAGAVMICLATLAKHKKTVISRGELIEIGGSFRLPEIMEASGTILAEVGTTNRTRIEDYESAIDKDCALLLRAHTSNYTITGFTQSATTSELSALSAHIKIPFIFDLGSGSLVDLSRFGINGEPTVRQVIEDGADLVTFSGDKLLGGPQAGIIAGKKELVEKIKRNPMKRALRCDKSTICALGATLKLYNNPEKVFEQIPTLRYLTRDSAIAERIARDLAQFLSKHLDSAEIKIIDDTFKAGAGALPTYELPCKSVAIIHKKLTPDQLAQNFRDLEIPIIGRIENDIFRLSPVCLDNIEEIKQALQ